MKLISKIIERVCFLLIITFTIVIFVQVFNRYVLKIPLAWSEELSVFLFQWVTMLGAVIAVNRMSHFSIDLVVRSLPIRLGRFLELLTPVLMGVVALIMIIEGFKLVQLTRYQIYTSMSFSRAWAYAAIPVSGFLMIPFLIQYEVKLWKEKKGVRS